jgi:hypothetical protein
MVQQWRPTRWWLLFVVLMGLSAILGVASLNLAPAAGEPAFGRTFRIQASLQRAALTLNLAALGAVGVEWRNYARHRRRARLGLCASCGYSLTGNTSGTCPECGTPVPAAKGVAP